MNEMLDELLFKLQIRSCDVKMGSTLFILGGTLVISEVQSISVDTMSGEVLFARVSKFPLLGTVVGETADTMKSMCYRLARADGYIFANLQTLRTPSAMAVKLKSWRETAQAIAVFQTGYLH